MYKCAASDCDNDIVGRLPQTKYCSHRCRYREHARKKRNKRITEGLCPQCGKQMDNDGSKTYCKHCKDYFRKRYYNNLKQTKSKCSGVIG